MTTVVADTGDLDAIKRLRPTDATTNPSLLLKAASLPQFADIFNVLKKSSDSLADRMDHFAVAVGTEINRLIPGVISTEVDARLSFNTPATITKAKRLIELYEKSGVSAERILIKVAATWEGIRAAELLERQGVHCNATLIFSFEQARACADAGVFLISPFVGRITDWHTQNTGLVISHPSLDPGVKSVSRIYNHLKKHSYDTVVMGASFRNIGQVESLAGCDRLTISPELLLQLEADVGDLPTKLLAEYSDAVRPTPITQNDFLLAINQDQMASEKLAEGIRRFIADQEKMEALLSAR